MHIPYTFLECTGMLKKIIFTSCLKMRICMSEIVFLFFAATKLANDHLEFWLLYNHILE